MQPRHDNIFYEIFKKLYAFYGPQHWWPAQTRLEMIIGAILTQNTSWKNVEKAIRNIKKEGALKVRCLESIKPAKLAALIRSSGYYNIKAARVKNFIRYLQTAYQGSLSKMFSEPAAFLRDNLLSVKGLGEETVDSILLYGGKKAIFVVDAYTRRIFTRHGLVKAHDSYQEIQNTFMRHLAPDVDLFNEYHALIVALGKNICRSKQPACSECPLRNIRKDKE